MHAGMRNLLDDERNKHYPNILAQRKLQISIIGTHHMIYEGNPVFVILLPTCVHIPSRAHMCTHVLHARIATAELEKPSTPQLFIESQMLS